MPLTILNVSYPLARISDDTAGGAEQILSTLDEALVRGGHNSLVIAKRGSTCRGVLLPTDPPDGILDERAQQLARNRHGDAIKRALARYPVDAVHLHGIDFPAYMPETTVPVIVTLHLPLKWYPPEAFYPRHQSYFVCVSHSQAALCPDVPIHQVIENGIRLPAPRGRTHKRPYVLAMGRICPEKGFHLAMDAATACGVRFLLAGKVYDYPAHREYFEHAIKPRLGKEHRFLGAVGSARKHQLLADAACLLVPSLAPETSSLVAMEAMACGTPVIAFRAGALSEIVDHGRTGFLVDSVEGMAEAISASGFIDPATCRLEAEIRFSADRMIEKYFALYQRAAAHRITENVELSH